MTAWKTEANYCWRLVATALSFLVFGIGGVLLTLSVFPALLCVPNATRAVKARWWIHKSFGCFMWLMEHLGVLRFEVTGREYLQAREGVLILANHPTLIDVVALIALTPNASCVVKQALWKNPFIGGVVRAAAYISNAQPEGVIDACVDDLQRTNALIVFPEGTRTGVDQPFRFQRGAAYIILRSACPVLPVLIQCDPLTLTKGVAWYRIPRKKCTLSVAVLPPMNAKAWVNQADPATLQARRLTSALEKFFTEQIEK